jgi:hypothetical protein
MKSSKKMKSGKSGKSRKSRKSSKSHKIKKIIYTKRTKTGKSKKMNGGNGKKCKCVDYSKKGSAYINFESGNKCTRDVVSGTDFCELHQDCLKFSQSFLNKFELPYQPEKWNGNPNIKESHNCYTYFLDKEVNPIKSKCKHLRDANKDDKCGDLKPQPGDFYMLVNNGSLDNKDRNYSCKIVSDRILNDNPSIQKAKFYEKCPTGSYKGAMVVDPGNTFHFYRQNADGTWSHKPGVLDITNVDASGDRIYFPHTANRNYKESKSSGINYTDFCGYYCIPRKGRVNMYAI